MWKPRSAEHLRRVLAELQESATFDAKEAVPPPKKAISFAVDVAAMANDGGSIVYGIAEDKTTGVLSEKPVPLAGQSERLSDVVHRVIADPPGFEVWDVPLPEDPSHGFLVVAVHASPMAPHMVDGRFWGRAGTINVELAQGEVDRLYARRKVWALEDDEVLLPALTEIPRPALADGRADLDIVVHPLLTNSTLLARAGLDVPERFAQALVDNTNAIRFAHQAPGAVLSALINGRFVHTLAGVAYEHVGGEPDHGRLELTNEGTIRFYWSSATRRMKGQVRTSVQDTACAQLATRVLRFAGDVLIGGGYDGPVTAVVSLRGAQHAVSDAWHDPGSQGNNLSTVPTNDYRRSSRVTVDDVVKDATEVARTLIGPLLRVVRPPGAPDPFTA